VAVELVAAGLGAASVATGAWVGGGGMTGVERWQPAASMLAAALTSRTFSAKLFSWRSMIDLLRDGFHRIYLPRHHPVETRPPNDCTGSLNRLSIDKATVAIGSDCHLGTLSQLVA
jgi:hypothetical protein